MNPPIKRLHTCAYCEPGVIHFIDPSIYKNDVIAKQDSSGKWKCGNCQDREIQDVIIEAAPNSVRAKEIIAEHTAEVSRHNEAARRLNQKAGHEAMKLKTNRYSNVYLHNGQLSQ
jgi:hypothetical protein